MSANFGAQKVAVQQFRSPTKAMREGFTDITDRFQADAKLKILQAQEADRFVF